MDDRRRLVGRVDFACTDRPLLIEVDSYRWHFGRVAWSRDRDLDLDATGATVLRVASDDIETRPAWVAEKVAAVLARMGA